MPPIESCLFQLWTYLEFEEIYRGQSFYQYNHGSNTCHDCMCVIEEANHLVNGFGQDEEAFEEEYEVDEMPENNTEKVMKKVKETNGVNEL